MPEEFASSCIGVLNLLAQPNPEMQEWEIRTSEVSGWFQLNLIPKALDHLTARLPARYLDEVLLSLDQTTPKHRLSKAMEYARSQNINPYRRWILFFTLASNPNLEEEDMWWIWRTYNYPGNLPFSYIIGNLVRNPSFPITKINPKDISANRAAIRSSQQKLSALKMAGTRSNPSTSYAGPV